MTGLQLTSEVVARITDTPGVDALDVFGPRIRCALFYWGQLRADATTPVVFICAAAYFTLIRVSHTF